MEITLALGIVAFALVGIVGVLPLAMTSSRQSADKTRASVIANMLFASFRSQPFQKVGYTDEQFNDDGTLKSNPTPAALDLNAVNTDVSFYATFLDASSPADGSTDTFGTQRRLRFSSTNTGGAGYLVTMHFNNQPDGTSSINPQPSKSVNGTPITPAQANQISLTISAVSRTQDQYHIISTVSNRTN